MAQHVERALEVHVDDGVEQLGGDVLERGVAQDAGVVHDDVDAAERVERALHDRRAALRRGDRVGVGHRFAAGVDDLGHHELGRGRRAARAVDRTAEVVHHDLGAAAGELERVAAAETTAGAGDDRDLSVVDAEDPWPETTNPHVGARISGTGTLLSRRARTTSESREKEARRGEDVREAEAPRSSRRSRRRPTTDADLSGWQQRALDRSLVEAKRRALNKSNGFVEAAMELLDETGGLNFTVQDVVDRSKLSLRSFYQTFASKDDLLLALFEECVATAADVATRADGEARRPDRADPRVPHQPVEQPAQPRGGPRPRALQPHAVGRPVPSDLAHTLEPQLKVLHEAVERGIASGPGP